MQFSMRKSIAWIIRHFALLELKEKNDLCSLHFACSLRLAFGFLFLSLKKMRL